MHEREKLKEAKYFYSRMKEEQEQEDRDSFKYNLSAFLSAARSVLMYARKEARTKRKGLKWYDDWINRSPILRFLGEKRHVDIHEEPIKPRADIEVTLTETVYVSESISIEHRDKNGKLISQYSSEEPKLKPKKPNSSVESKTTFRFNDWMKECQSKNLKEFTGNEDIMTLCERYIQELEKVVKDGVNKGFITG